MVPKTNALSIRPQGRVGIAPESATHHVGYAQATLRSQCSPPHGYIAQWLERLTADQQVPGSNPGVPFGCCGVVTHTLQLWKGRATGPVTVAQQLLWCIHPARIELATFSVLG